MQNTIETALPKFFGTAQHLMFDTKIVGVAARMIFTYLPLSLVGWTIGERVERALNNRVVDLDRGLRELLKDPDISRLVKQVYNHGMIGGRFKVLSETSRGQSTRPSYIPSRDLALAGLGSGTRVVRS